VSRHVVLLRRDPSLGLALRALLYGTGRVTELQNVQAWSDMPAEGIDAVVIDLPPSRRKQAIDLVRSRFDGRLVLVLDPHDDPAGVPTNHPYAMVQRPFEIVELWHLVTTDPSWIARPGPGAPSPGRGGAADPGDLEPPGPAGGPKTGPPTGTEAPTPAAPREVSTTSASSEAPTTQAASRPSGTAGPPWASPPTAEGSAGGAGGPEPGQGQEPGRGAADASTW
jgi:hypothetical protein